MSAQAAERKRTDEAAEESSSLPQLPFEPPYRIE